MIRIVTDSVASIPHDVAEAQDIKVMSLYVNRDGREYVDATMDVDAFYEEIYDMLDDIPTSSMPSRGEMESLFEEAAHEGDEVLGIFMSSRMSGTLDMAHRAARAVQARLADFHFRLVDSMSNSYDEAFAVFAAATARDSGCTLDQCAEIAADAVARTRFLFAPESLRFLQAGGRIGNAAALLGKLVKLCPVITVSDGESSTFAKVRTHKKALAAIADAFAADVREYGLEAAVVHYIGSSAEAIQWSREKITPIVGHEPLVLPVSPVIGLHVGPAVGIAYRCERTLPGKLSEKPSSLVYAS